MKNPGCRDFLPKKKKNPGYRDLQEKIFGRYAPDQNTDLCPNGALMASLGEEGSLLYCVKFLFPQKIIFEHLKLVNFTFFELSKV